jgi:transcriptional regulator with XRE-family HTH domain
MAHKDILDPCASWWAMTDQERLATIRNHGHLTYPQIAQKCGASNSAVAQFARKHGIRRANLNAAKKHQRSFQLCDLAAPLWSAGVTNEGIARELGISRSYLATILSDARARGDVRFPYRCFRGRNFRKARPSAKPVRKEFEEGALRSCSVVDIGRAFLRERHPDGTKYSPSCIFEAHRGIGATYRAPAVRVRISQRELTSLIQDKRVSA